MKVVKKFGKKKQIQRKSKPKNENSRKELRKKKREQKKVNRFNYHNVKKKERIKALKSGKKLPGRAGQNNDDSEESGEDMELDDDESIPSEFEGSDDEEDLDGSTSDKPLIGKVERNILKSKKEEKEYYDEIKKNRIEQLKTANEEEDKIIKKYETLLKLNKKKKSKSGSTSKSFNDGLDYILELCSEENIKKMYSAAKEVASSEDEFGEDLELLMEDPSAKTSDKKKKKLKKKQKLDEKDQQEDSGTNLNQKDLKRLEKLKKAEEKYFGDDEDFFKSMDADSCEGSDSEFDDEMASDDEGPEEIASKKPSKVKFADQTEDKKLLDSDDSDFDIANDSEEEDDVEEEDLEMAGSEEESGPEIAEEDGSDNEEEDDSDKKGKSGEWEDIYGRKRDKDGNLVKETTGKYVPPQLRKKLEDAKAQEIMDPKRREKYLNLKKQLKGFVNRLAETNLHRISIDIENIYGSNARHDVNSLLTEIILDSLVSNVLTSDRMVLEHNLLIATLHANIGSEIGAYFLQIIIERFNECFKCIDSGAVEEKTIDNLTLIVCHLYTYKIFEHHLIYELLEKFSEKLTEKRVECMLLVLRSIGFLLRKDDPLKLKEFIIELQKKANDLGEDIKSSSRIMYMIDVLLAIKNNNMTKIPQYDSSLVEHFRKLLKQFVRPGKYVTTLNITMEDLLNADERGKWWLVGSAWTGANKSEKSQDVSKNGNAVLDEQRQKILELARKQRMNTDDKKNIFYILMTAEDYMDAFEKIISSVKDERAIVAVIVHCCLSEKIYNPYYSVLAQKFCEHNRKYQLTIQYTIWDKIKILDELDLKQVRNLARFLIFLIENGNLPLSVLKVIEFSQIEKTTLRFLRQVMLGILMTDDEKFKQVFERIAPSAKLKAFKDSLRLFLKCFLIKDQKNINISEEQLELLKARMQICEKLLSYKQY